MKKLKEIAIIGIVILSLLVLLFTFFLNSKITLEEKVIPATLYVQDKPGFDLNTSILTFGAISPGTSSDRKVSIKNDYSFPIKVEISVEGNINEFLSFEPVFELEPNEEKEISISTIDPEGKPEGNYSGNVIFTMKRNF